MNICSLRERTAANFDRLVEDLSDLIRIPSMSSAAFDQEPLAQSARKVADLFAAEGMEVEVCSVPGPDGWQGRPAVLAHKHVSDSAPSVLLYAHHDVQPGGDPSRWTTPPFEPSIRDGRLYGRGASDDGAGIMVHLGTMRVLGDDLGVNVTCFIEGEEESGSPSFQNFLKTYQDRLKSDVIIVCDSDNWKVGVPALTTSLRGVNEIYCRVKVSEHAVHSGMFGGPVLDAVTLACRLIASLHDENGDVAVPGLGGSDKAEVTYDESELRSQVGLVDSYKLAGTGDLAARLWTKPALSVIGMNVTSVAEHANVIAPECEFVLSLRIAPGEDGEKCSQAVADYLKAHAPLGAQVEVRCATPGPSYQANLDSPATQDTLWALEQAWQRPAVTIGTGGSIPFISDFVEFFPQAEVVVTGVEDPHTNAHSENESQDLGDLQNAVLAQAILLSRLAGKL